MTLRLIGKEMNAFGIALEEKCVRIFNDPITKQDALELLTQAAAQTGHVKDPSALLKALTDREDVMSTGIGGGVAIPHVRISAVSHPLLAVGISSQGIEYNTLDNEPVHVIVLFAMPAGSQKEYLGLLAQVMTVMKDPVYLEELKACSTPREVVDQVQGYSE